MAESGCERSVVMSIHPRYANEILAGRKTIEFRKRALPEDVRIVWIYSTAPVQRVVGYFEVDRIEEGSPADLWGKYSAIGGIDHSSYHEYYAGYDRAVGLIIRSVEMFESPLAISELLPSGVPPQSYAYAKIDPESVLVSR